MNRYKLTLEYDGTPYSGWQRQVEQLSVQQVVEEAIARFCGHGAPLTVAGRTDAGVHALAQVAHVDLQTAHDPFRVKEAVNFHLRPHPVAILEAEAVPPEFHARFSATQRHYCYRILARRAPLTIDAHRAWRVAPPLDVQAMHRTAQSLVGTHDFTSFRDSLCQAKSPVKTLERLDVIALGEEIRIECSARSFLHHQMRNMAGSLVLVGKGRWTHEDFIAARDARDRRKGGPTAPPEGLYLTGVDY